MEFFLFFLRKISQLHAVLEPTTRLLISEKSAPQYCFFVNCNKYEKIPPPCPYFNLHVYLILENFPTYTLLKLHAY
jgi:hypothetical protein